MISSLNIVILGIIISIIYYEITEVSPGGIIVPGLLVAYINQPERLAMTLIVSLLAYFIIKLLSKKILIFGKRRFVVLILTALFVSICIHYLSSWLNLFIASISIIGYIIPGIIANDYYKQGILKTITSMIIVTGLLEIIVLISNSL